MAKESEKLCIDAFNSGNKQQALKYLQQCREPSEIVTKFSNCRASTDLNKDLLIISNVSLLHIAAKNNWSDVASSLITNYRCNPEARNNRCSTPLHYAARYGSMETLKCLISQHRCNPMSLTKNKWTALHWASSMGHVNVLRYLIEECHCDPSLCDAKGHTLLHLACAGNHFEAARYLLETGMIDPVLQDVWECSPSKWGLSMSNGDIHRTIALLTHYEECRMESPIDTYTQIFVLGNKGVGKSTLVKLLKTRSELDENCHFPSEDGNVTNVTLNTIGIVPENITSSEIGNMIVYDLSGDAEYHYSHSTIMKTATKAGLALYILVVDISLTTQSIKKQLYYWFNYLCTMSGATQLNVLIVGSHADVLTDKQNTHDVGKVIEAIVSKEYPLSITNFDFIPMDCRKVFSNEIFQLSRNLLFKSLSTIAKSLSTNYNCHALYSFLKAKQTHHYCTLGELAKMINENDEYLPSNEYTLAKLLTQLSLKGLILFLEKEHSLGDSWVIIDIQYFLHNVNGLLFSPQHDLSSVSNIGIVPISWIRKTFPEHSPLLLSDILNTLEVCQIIDSSNGGACTSDSYLFFPSFVTSECPKSLPPQHDFGFKWVLECVRHSQFFPVQFCHMLFLKLALNFPLKAIKSSSSSSQISEASRRCQLWKFGIYWQTDDLVESLVELSEDIQQVVVSIKWNEDSTNSIKAMMKLRSSIIATINSLCQKYCTCIELGEFMEIPYSSHDHYSHQFAIQDVVHSICLKKPGVLSSDSTGSKAERLNRLLLHEPLTSIPQNILFKIFTCECTDLFMDSHDLQHLNLSLKPFPVFTNKQKFSIIRSKIEEYSIFKERTIVQEVYYSSYVSL